MIDEVAVCLPQLVWQCAKSSWWRGCKAAMMYVAMPRTFSDPSFEPVYTSFLSRPGDIVCTADSCAWNVYSGQRNACNSNVYERNPSR